MGAIPVVRRSDPNSAVVEGLPVVIVDDWAQVRPDRMADEAARRDPSPDYSRLTLAYWQAQINVAMQAADPPVSHCVGVKPGGYDRGTNESQ